MTRQQVERAIDALIEDLADRRGIGHEWFEIDPDTQSEIRETWVELVRRELDRETS